MMNDLRRFNLVYTAVSGDVTGSWFEKVSGDFYRKVTGKWLRKTQKKKVSPNFPVLRNRKLWGNFF